MVRVTVRVRVKVKDEAMIVIGIILNSSFNFDYYLLYRYLNGLIKSREPDKNTLQIKLY